MKKIQIILFTLLLTLMAVAQEIRVEDFHMLSHDLTANIKGTERFDPNTRKNAALIKIETTEKGFYFDGGMMGLVGDPIQNAGEIWVYIPEGSKKITLRHSELGTLRDYFYPEKIISGRTYLMKLATTPKSDKIPITILCAKPGAEVYLDGEKKGEIQSNNTLGIPDVAPGTHTLKVQLGGDFDEKTIEVTKNNFSFEAELKSAASMQNFIIFNVTPADAVIMLDGEILQNTGGMAKKLVKFGSHNYTISAKNYHTQQGNVLLNENIKKQVNVTLKPAFGYIDVQGTSAQGGVIYIDNDLLGTAPKKSEPLASGNHNLKIVKNLYKSYEETVAVKDGETTIVTPQLVADYSKVTLKAESKTEIWINGEKRGVGEWSGNLQTGDYLIETKQSGYESSQQTLSVTPTMSQAPIILNAPKPIYGTLSLDIEPLGSIVYINGEKKGETPLYLSEILIGTHQIKVEKQGYAPWTGSVTIKKGEISQLTATLQNTKLVRFTSTHSNAQLYVDNQYLGSATGEYNLTYGTHNIVCKAQGEKDFTTTINVTQGPIIQTVESSFTLTNNGHEYVDLGLSVKWATCNVGATTPEGYGYYFAWGETTPKSSYTDDNYTYSSNPTTLPLSADAARANWGGSWRMPTRAEQDELRNNCTWTWTTQKGVKGYKVTSKKNGNTIFLPAAGYRGGSTLIDAGEYGRYWSSSLDTSYSYGASYLYFDSGGVDWDGDYRCLGPSVRAVCE